MRKIFLICLAILLAIPAAAGAKKNDGLPEEDRIKIAVEIINTSRYKDLNPAQNLEIFLSDKLIEKNLINIVGTKTFGDSEPKPDGLILDEDKTVDAPTPAENIGEILIFDAVEIPPPSAAKNFDPAAYAALGAKYIVRCEVLGIGATKVEDKTISMLSGIIGSGLSLSGAGSKNRDKTLRRVGTGIGLIGFGSLLDVTKRTALNTVVRMEFIDAQTGEILWQENFIGQAVKHHSARKGYANPWEQAYSESVEETAKKISKRVNKYIDRVVIKGKSDKSFTVKNFKLGNLTSGKLF